MSQNSLTHRQRAGLPARTVNALDLRQGSRTERVSARRRQEPKPRGGRQGIRRQLMAEVD